MLYSMVLARRPWNMPHSIRIFLPTTSSRYFDPVVVRVAPKNVSFIAACSYHNPRSQSRLKKRKRHLRRCVVVVSRLLPVETRLDFDRVRREKHFRPVEKGRRSEIDFARERRAPCISVARLE